MRCDQRVDILEICLFSRLDKDSRRLFNEVLSESSYIGDMLVLQAIDKDSRRLYDEV